jgi:hypothetical protein
VRHVEAENIHARVHQPADHPGGIGGGAERGNDFGAADGSLSHAQNIQSGGALESFLIAQKFRRQIELAFGGKGGHIPRRTLN